MNPDSIVKEFNRMFKGLAYKNYDFRLINTCPSFRFHIREPNEKNEKSVVVFAGNPKHLSSWPGSDISDDNEDIGTLIGFISDAKELNNYFKIEFERLSRFACKESADKNRLISFIISLLEKNGIKGKWET
ncbi:Uncharacterized protein dnl_37620 [Desulfonema limicola]|uniref:DUF4304 domain-containing protein n=1 Tax=Desulfonema limicola TaxID=45656 RepID=A0A975B9Q4_9BACT|nr:hypothetical protein [Desulfonema limicola]QTA81427.1 Uncharacterized protein dnl_37620 [Desulfonema limicola]